MAQKVKFFKEVNESPLSTGGLPNEKLPFNSKKNIYLKEVFNPILNKYYGFEWNKRRLEIK